MCSVRQSPPILLICPRGTALIAPQLSGTSPFTFQLQLHTWAGWDHWHQSHPSLRDSFLFPASCFLHPASCIRLSHAPCAGNPSPTLGTLLCAQQHVAPCGALCRWGLLPTGPGLRAFWGTALYPPPGPLWPLYKPGKEVALSP